MICLPRDTISIRFLLLRQKASLNMYIELSYNNYRVKAKFTEQQLLLQQQLLQLLLLLQQHMCSSRLSATNTSTSTTTVPSTYFFLNFVLID